MSPLTTIALVVAPLILLAPAAAQQPPSTITCADAQIGVCCGKASGVRNTKGYIFEQKQRSVAGSYI